MKSGLNIKELAAEIFRQSEAQRDFKSPTTELEIVFDRLDRELLDERANSARVAADQKKPVPQVQPKLQISGHGEFAMTPLMHDQVGTYAGIPAKYYDRMLAEQPVLLADNINCWMHAKKETRMVRTMDNRARAFLSNRYRTIDNVQVAEAVLPIFSELGPKMGLRIESTNVSETRLYIKAVTTKLESTIKRAQTVHGLHGAPKEEIVVQSGIVISNSEVGLHSFKIEPMIFILACFNGAIIPGAGMRRYHIGRHTDEREAAIEVFADDTRKADDRALLLKMRDVVKASFDEIQFRQLTTHLSVTTGNRIEGEINKAIEKTVELYNLPITAKDGILKHLVQGGDLTQWGLSNAATAYAQDDALDYEEATQLERVGGDLLMLEPDKWQSIAAAV